MIIKDLKNRLSNSVYPNKIEYTIDFQKVRTKIHSGYIRNCV